jgi:transposase-like protein
MAIPTIKTIQNILFVENDCIAFLKDKDIIYKIENCVKCNSDLYQNSKIYRCKNKECQKSLSVFTNSFFAKNHIICSDILLISYYWLCKAKYTTINLITGHSSTTIVKYMNIFQNIVINTITEDDITIGGKNIICELDESKFKKNETWWIVGGVERTPRRKCFLVIADNRDKETLRHIIKKHIRAGSIVHTDHWKGYSCVSELGFRHRKVNHSKNRIERGTGVHTNNIEGLWAGIKLNISSRNRNKEIIKKYLLEFIYRRKHSDNLWNAFLEALKTCKH